MDRVPESAREELRARNAELEAIFRALPDLLFELAPDGRIVSYRAGRAEDLYTSPSEFLGKRMVDVLPPGPSAAFQGAVERVLAGEKLARVEYALDVASGAKHFEARFVAIDGGNVIALVRDVTEQHRALEERRELDLRVQETQRLESLGVLAGGIAHDYNNLLAGILAGVDLALRQVPPGSALAEPLEIARESAWRASELSRQLLAYAGKGRMEVRHVDVGALVLDTAQLLDAAMSRRARIDLDLPRDLPAVHADVAQLRQVAMNLITNAAGACDGGGRVRVATRALESLGEGRAPEGRWVELVVADDGRGMDEPTRQRMFDPFFTTKGPGRGLGLAAVLGIVRAHAGMIEVESAPGTGTRVRVLLPASDGLAEVTARAPVAGLGRIENGAVLLVDDEPAIRATLGALLAQYGLEVWTARDGKDALDAFARHQPIDVVILDLTMPNLGGDETLARLREIDPTLPVILTSGYDESESRGRAEASPHAFLQKPFRTEALLAAVRSALAQRAVRH
jgi:signal transduction histidine kinase/CheY-like chemotaxis protein